MARARQTKPKVKVNEAGYAVGGSAAFMNEARDAKMQREALAVGKDCSYDPKKDFLKPKTHFYVDMSPKVTDSKKLPFSNLCTRGETTCRHSNERIKSKIQLINEEYLKRTQVVDVSES